MHIRANAGRWIMLDCWGLKSKGEQTPFSSIFHLFCPICFSWLLSTRTSPREVAAHSSRLCPLASLSETCSGLRVAFLCLFCLACRRFTRLRKLAEMTNPSSVGLLHNLLRFQTSPERFFISNWCIIVSMLLWRYTGSRFVHAQRKSECLHRCFLRQVLGGGRSQSGARHVSFDHYYYYYY